MLESTKLSLIIFFWLGNCKKIWQKRFGKNAHPLPNLRWALAPSVRRFFFRTVWNWLIQSLNSGKFSKTSQIYSLTKKTYLMQEWPDFKFSRTLIFSFNFKRSLVLWIESSSKICCTEIKYVPPVVTLQIASQMKQ